MTLPQPISPSDSQSLEEFRNAAAGLIKSLLRARLVQEPNFLTHADRRRWKVEDADGETRSCASLLTKVRQLNEQFQQRFTTGLDSVSAPDDTAEEEQLERLLYQVGQFVCGDLDEAIRQADNGQTVAWESLAHWDWLRDIRDALDQLPEKGASVPGPQQEKRITVVREMAIVYIDGKPYPLNGTEKVKTRLAEFFEAVIEADGGLVSMTDFDVRTAHIEAQPHAVRDLLESQPGAGTRIPRDKLYK